MPELMYSRMLSQADTKNFAKSSGSASTGGADQK